MNTCTTHLLQNIQLFEFSLFFTCNLSANVHSATLRQKHYIYLLKLSSRDNESLHEKRMKLLLENFISMLL